MLFLGFLLEPQKQPFLQVPCKIISIQHIWAVQTCRPPVFIEIEKNSFGLTQMTTLSITCRFCPRGYLRCYMAYPAPRDPQWMGSIRAPGQYRPGNRV